MTADATTPETLADLPGFTETAQAVEHAAHEAREHATQRAALLDILERWADPPASYLAKLPKPTKKDATKARCPECGGWHGLPAVHLDYMGHADVTEALLRIDPWWSWEPAAIDPATGGPAIQAKGNRLVMWGRLTVLGVARLGVGTCSSGKDDPEKELIGDMIRNAAMRFGFALRLWSKADHLDTTTPDDEAPPAAPDRLTVAQVKGRMAAELGRELAREWWTEHGPADEVSAEGWTVADADALVAAAIGWAAADPERAERTPRGLALAELAAAAGGDIGAALEVAAMVAGNAGYPVPSSWDDLEAAPMELLTATAAELADPGATS